MILCQRDFLLCIFAARERHRRCQPALLVGRVIMLVGVVVFRDLVDEDQILNLPKPFLRRSHNKLAVIEYDLHICGPAGTAPFPASGVRVAGKREHHQRHSGNCRNLLFHRRCHSAKVVS